MKRLLYTLMAMILPFSAAAGVNFSMKLDCNEVLQYEPMYAYMHIQNDSDVPFVIDPADKANPTKIKFRITRGGEQVETIPTDASIVGKVTIKPDETRKLMIDLSKWYEVGTMGKYVVTPVVVDDEGTYEGKKRVVDVVYGGRLIKITKSAPGKYDDQRSYQLLYWNRKGYERLFLRVDSVKSGYNYGVVELGTLIRVMKPSLLVDRRGNVEIFHQSMPAIYVRSRFKSNYDGLHFVDQKSEINEMKVPVNSKATKPGMELPPMRKRK